MFGFDLDVALFQRQLVIKGWILVLFGISSFNDWGGLWSEVSSVFVKQAVKIT